MKTSKAGIELIKEFEGCVLHWYDIGDGMATVGYGHAEPIAKAKGKLGQVITMTTAENLLKSDLAKFEKLVSPFEKVLNQNQYDALVSFCYNCGDVFTQYPTIGNNLKRKNYQYVTDSMANFINRGSQFEGGLRRRRAAEIALFNTPVVGSNNNVVVKNTPKKKIVDPKHPNVTVVTKPKVGKKVIIKSGATQYQTGENIPDFVKGPRYTIQQVKEVNQSISKYAVLLKEITSWVLMQDVK
jgi:GH24 family phage-related lysozyme (muramidase)